MGKREGLNKGVNSGFLERVWEEAEERVYEEGR